MDKHKIIMISGKQGSGKTSIMNNIIILAAREGLIAHNIIFAQTIYDIHDYARELMRFRGIERPDKDGKLLQLLGTEWGRKVVAEDVWIKALHGNIQNISPTPKPNQLFVVSDCRFRNEFDGVDAFRVRLEASKEVRFNRCDSWRDTDTHVSETDLDEYAALGKFDLTINTETSKPEDVAAQILKEFNNGNYIRRDSGSSTSVCGDSQPQEQGAGEGECGTEDNTIPSTVEGEVK